MDSRDIREIVLRVNGEDAQQKIDSLTRRLDAARKAKQQLDAKYADGGDWSKKDTRTYTALCKEIDRCTRSLQRTRAGADEVDKALSNMGKAGPRQLQRTLKQLEASLNKVERGSRDWDKLTEGIRRTQQEIENIKREQTAFTEMSGRLRQWGDRWMGVATSIQGAIASLSGVRRVAEEAVQAYADMAEAQSQVTKYTGLTADEVRTLNEDFKRMDTRTSREQLNALAGDAGRLGINELAQSSSAARLNVKKFTQLVRTDANAALMEFAAAVGKMIGGN